MNRIDILNAIISKNQFKKYCEIGVQAGHCFNGVNCDYKVGVDPDLSSAATVHKTSDDFFSTLNENFNIYWVDGLHHAETVERDILNALNNLEEGGYICCHDMLPTNFHMTEIPLTDQSEWTGDCYKAFVKLRTERNDLDFVTVDTDWGVGIITKKHPGTEGGLLQIDGPIDYEGFVQNRNIWMNVISCEEFKQRFL